MAVEAVLALCTLLLAWGPCPDASGVTFTALLIFRVMAAGSIPSIALLAPDCWLVMHM
ncbi:hypothetical protein C2G38_2156786 [Gigaspora rosea]|uniref:Uncharacterized protein n=1 Tax=Gigaspora rosea TaxID=44941 RepID=A0A397W4C8_9GLOM|nr:hypothetical protein C2G38_2156786 [Gigaspora rosea]